MRVDVLSTAGITSWGAMPATDLEQSVNSVAAATGEENGTETPKSSNGARARVKANGLRRQSTKVFSG